MIVGTEPLLMAQDFSAHRPAADDAGRRDEGFEGRRGKSFERDHIRRIIAERRGDKRQAARDLGISLSSLYRHLDLKHPG